MPSQTLYAAESPEKTTDAGPITLIGVLLPSHKGDRRLKHILGSVRDSLSQRNEGIVSGNASDRPFDSRSSRRTVSGEGNEECARGSEDGAVGGVGGEGAGPEGGEGFGGGGLARGAGDNEEVSS